MKTAESQLMITLRLANRFNTLPQAGLVGTFGMPQLNKLDIHLKCPEYKDKANITVIKGNRNGAEIPVGIHFANEKGDFQNDYRFMNAEIINEKLKTIKFNLISKDWKMKVAALGGIIYNKNLKKLKLLKVNSIGFKRFN
jgi:hypothetical protein